MEDAPLQSALEKLADADIVLVQGLPPESNYRFKHALIQDAAYENLLKSRRQLLHRRVAENLRERFAETAAEPEVLAHHFTQAGMTDAAIEWWGNAGDHALRRSAFQEAIFHLGKAIEMADKEDAAATTPARERLKLQTAYGRAVAWSRGFGTDETKAAFSRAQEIAVGARTSDDQFAAYYGVYLGSMMRGELGSARDIAEKFLREAERASRPTEVGVALRYLGLVDFWQRDFASARGRLLRSLELFDADRDRDAKSRFGIDNDVGALQYLAPVELALGQIGHAQEAIEQAIARATASDFVPNEVNAFLFKAIFEATRGDARSTLPAAVRVVQMARKNGMALFALFGAMFSGWARSESGDQIEGASELRQAFAFFMESGNKLGAPFILSLLAKVEANSDDPKGALANLDAALALANETGEHWTDALLHRLRGEVLLKHDTANTASAEEAFVTAIAVAQQQKARSFELRAALSLAKLYQSTGRPSDAHGVLARAVEGFSPTPEFREVEEAQALLAVLAGSEEVKSAVAARRQRIKLQASYGRAVMFSQGFGVEQAKSAFTRAKELAAGIDDLDEQFDAHYGLWIGAMARGELAQARENAENLWRQAESCGRTTELAIGLRCLGLTCLFQGELTEAQANLYRALRTYDPQRDKEAKFRLGADTGVAATAYLALVSWHHGEISRARDLIDEALARSVEVNHVPTQINTSHIAAFIETFRGDTKAAMRLADTIIGLAREHGLALYVMWGTLIFAWARAHLGERETGMREIGNALAAHAEQGNKLFVPLFQGLLAELELKAQNEDAALVRANNALALAVETGEHWTDSFLHRLRGEILFGRGPANAAPAEEAFLRAIQVARKQKARTFELRAALSLARLYREMNRAADAHAVLAPALEGFSPAPEFPEIEAAERLLAALAESDEVKTAAASRQRRLKLQTAYGRAVAFSRGLAPTRQSPPSPARGNSQPESKMPLSDPIPITGFGLEVWCAVSSRQRMRLPTNSDVRRRAGCGLWKPRLPNAFSA
jgi:predicted ATPase